MRVFLEVRGPVAEATQWINEAQKDKEAARKKLGALPAATRRKESPLEAQRTWEMTESLGGIAQCIHAANADEKSPLYEALGTTISHEHTARTATVRSRPSSAYRQCL